MNSPELIRASLGDRLVHVPRHNRDATRRAFFDCSQTLRRLAHRAKREALEWEARGHHANYAHCRTEADRLWRSAIWHLSQARI